MSDPRQNRPSASGLERLQLCPGSWNAERGLPEQPNDWSEGGTLIHAAWAGSGLAFESLDNDQLTALQNIEQKTEDLVEALGFNGEQVVREFEMRLWSPTLKISGQSDRTYRDHARSRALILDGKTGWGKVTTPAENLQLRALALIEHQNTGAKEVYVAIVSAWRKGDAPCVYSGDDFIEAEKEIAAILSRAENPDAPRTPSENACQYCRAKTNCPEARDFATSMSVVAPTSVGALTTQRLAEYLNRVALSRKVCDALEAEAKRRIANGEAVPGWELKQGEAREKIVNLPAVHAQAAQEFGVTVEQFTEACSLTKKAAKEMLQKATGRKGKSLDAALDFLIAGNTKPGNPPEPSLVRISDPNPKQKAA